MIATPSRLASRRDRISDVIFLSNTPAARVFDVGVIVTIVLSVSVVMLDSSQMIRARYGPLLNAAEWTFTAMFTIEYMLRLVYARKRLAYAVSFFGVIDLVAILPALVGLIFPSSRYLGVLRVVRIMRVFRVLKLVAYMVEANVILRALRDSRRKITVFLFAVLIIAIVLGSVMYVIEGDENGFTSIPRALYWAIVTLTTVGYGDLTPATPAGQALATVIMVMGYGMIAVPTGLVTAELARETLNRGLRDRDERSCSGCGKDGHEQEALFCIYCGTHLPEHDSG